MVKLLIASFDMEVGGVERSLINMLEQVDYGQYDVNLMLYRHTGDLLSNLPDETELLEESRVYRTFRLPISQVIASGQIHIGLTRLLAKYKPLFENAKDKGYRQMQYMWKYAMPFLPEHTPRYDVAISYLWPHYFVAERVTADIKIAWVHTDFSFAETNEQEDIIIWQRFDHIVAVSEACKQAFINKYPALTSKVHVMENLTSPQLIRQLATEKTAEMMLADPRFKLVTVARLSYAKGIDQAVEALKQLKDMGYEDIAWYVVGYGGDEKQIKQLIKEHDLEDAFILLGKHINPYPFIKAGDVYVQPSRFEGKAVTVKEAQILGKPILITNYPTAADQIQHKQDGLICERSSQGLVKGIETLYQNTELRDRLAAANHATDHTNQAELEKMYQLMKGENSGAKQETG